MSDDRSKDPRLAFPDVLSFADISAEITGYGVGGGTVVVKDHTPDSAFPGVWMTFDEARALRDWLNKVLP